MNFLFWICFFWVLLFMTITLKRERGVFEGAAIIFEAALCAMDFLIAFSAGVLGYKSYLAMQRHSADRHLTVDHIKPRKPDEPLTPLPDCSSTADPLKQQAALHSVESAFAH
ncbi:hypothetical protein T492DRAFT_846807 [Pavlovales sp. CCMP2436]|nr:hypothetical protein T492DRAFT_846807 [Pavlovales sp. CCMP2436]